MRTVRSLTRHGFIGAALATVLLAANVYADPSAPPSPTTGPMAAGKAAAAADHGPVTGLWVDAGRPTPGEFLLAGRDAQQQLVVTGEFAGGKLRDLTRDVVYQAEPADVVSISDSGLVTPLREGRAQITVRHAQGQSAAIAVTVTHLMEDVAVNFPNQIVPIFTKYGCNGGGCHGKASGQNGFRLSLLGFEPDEDYEHLVKEGRGRRLSPAAPDRSLLLVKSVGSVPHGGGMRMEIDSPPYRLLRRWIAQGLPYGNADDPTVVHIEVFPEQRTLSPGQQQQVICIAHYSDGSTEDVTAMTQFEPNDPEMAEVGEAGLVTAGTLTGNVAIMARYQGQVAVFRAVIPLGITVEQLPPARNFIDQLVFKQLQTLGMPPSAICDDATFVRRVAIDIAGRLPTVDETQQFLADSGPDKRARWIEQLLASTDYADYFANKWSAVLRNKRSQPSYTRGTYLFHQWIRDSLHQNRPFDEFVRDVIAAAGDVGEHPPVAWYREVRDSTQQLEDTAQLFLGLRIQCARCHHHPFEKWSQEDYYGLGAFFSRVGRKPGMAAGEERIFHQRGVASAVNPKTRQSVRPIGLDSGGPLDLSAEDDPRHALVDWMAQPDNPYFAKALVNRYWKHFFGRGLVDPEDDMRVTNPASNPELLDALANHFVESGFDLKELVRTITNSTVYQLSAEPNAFNASDKQNFSRYYPRRLNAEVLLDSIDLLTGTTTRFSGLPAGTRAVQLPDASVNSYFLTVFGRPEGASACECERTGDANLAQSLHLLNSADIQGKLQAPQGRVATLAADKQRSDEAKIVELYLQAFSRLPDADELDVALRHLAAQPDKKQGLEDIVWALINTKEFLFNH
jgi:hypothetical protein